MGWQELGTEDVWGRDGGSGKIKVEVLTNPLTPCFFVGSFGVSLMIELGGSWYLVNMP